MDVCVEAFPRGEGIAGGEKVPLVHGHEAAVEEGDLGEDRQPGEKRRSAPKGSRVFALFSLFRRGGSRHAASLYRRCG